MKLKVFGLKDLAEISDATSAEPLVSKHSQEDSIFRS